MCIKSPFGSSYFASVGKNLYITDRPAMTSRTGHV